MSGITPIIAIAFGPRACIANTACRACFLRTYRAVGDGPRRCSLNLLPTFGVVVHSICDGELVAALTREKGYLFQRTSSTTMVTSLVRLAILTLIVGATWCAGALEAPTNAQVGSEASLAAADSKRAPDEDISSQMVRRGACVNACPFLNNKPSFSFRCECKSRTQTNF